MTRMFKLLLVGSVVAYVAAVLRRRTSARAHTEAHEAPESRGISDVDPGPLTQFGEAVDREAIQDAHAEPALLRDQLPVPGKNLP